jgi:NAD(P)-dependent dehydrogenase (short-subunit alcohol dehydrogenase family)
MTKATTQKRPGRESLMQPAPDFVKAKTSAKLANKVALITGGDSGIGRAVALLFAQHGADICISYLNEHDDAKETQQWVESVGSKCVLVPGDISREAHCKKVVSTTMKLFGKIDILVNNAAIHYPAKALTDITTANLKHTFEVNVFSFFYLTRAVLPYLKRGSCIINTSSVVAYRGSPHLIDYAATKAAIVGFTRSLATNLAPKGIRVNGVAPGPIWTPLVPSSFKNKGIKKHGEDTPLGRTGQPVEVAPCYLFLASEDSSYISGQFLHPNGGEIING